MKLPLLATLNLENISDYLVPIGILILYFVMTAGKGKKPSTHQEEPGEQLPPPLPKRAPPSHPGPPPVSRRQEVLRSEIEERKIHSEVETRRFSASLQERNSDPLSEEMHKHIDSDPAYALRTEKKVSHARRLLTSKASLRQAFLLKEILRNPESIER